MNKRFTEKRKSIFRSFWRARCLLSQRLNTIFWWNRHHLWQRAVSSAVKLPAKPSEEVLTSKQFLYHSHMWIRHKKECLWVNMCASVLSRRGWLVLVTETDQIIDIYILWLGFEPLSVYSMALKSLFILHDSSVRCLFEWHATSS